MKDTKKLSKNYFGTCKCCGNEVSPVFNLEKKEFDSGERYVREVESVYCKTCKRIIPLEDRPFDVEVSEETYARMMNTPDGNDADYFTKSYRVVVSGDSSFCDYTRLCCNLDKCLSRKVSQKIPIEIVSGREPGAEILGERYAKDRGYDLVYSPVMTTFVKDRYQALALYADAVVVFWDGRSENVKKLLAQAELAELQIRSNIITHK